MPLIVTDTPQDLQRHHQPFKTVALIPTMGNLHQGHLHLIKLASHYADQIIVSIFVNRLQFGPNEDFDNYPRTLEDDCKALDALNLSKEIIVFAPAESTLYPTPQTFGIIPSPMADTLEGHFRPGFFKGVCTIVMKLFHIVTPSITVFGKKDRQQITLIRQMIDQFALPIQLIESETIREADGLALSSRNSYLSSTERFQAPQLYQALSRSAESIRQGNHNYPLLERQASEFLSSHGWDVNYVAIRDSATLSAHPSSPDTPAVVLGAARLGNTRLIDNVDV